MVHLIAGTDPDNNVREISVDSHGEMITSPSMPKDASGLSGFNGIFGDSYVSHRVPKFSANFTHPIDTRSTLTSLLNGGTASLEGNLLAGNTGTDPNGSVTIQSKDNLRYTAGRDAEVMFTGIFTIGVSNSAQRGGLFDDNDGIFLGYEGVDFGVTIRKNATDIFTKQTKFNIDPIDGNGKSKFKIDTTKMNIFRITYGYLGIAPIIYQVYGGIENGWITFHVHNVSNKQSETHIANPYLPVRFQVVNSGNTSEVIMRSGSIYAGTIDGTGSSDASSREFSKKVSAVSASPGIDKLIIFFPNKSVFSTVPNKISDLLLKVGVGVESNKPVVINLYKIPTEPALAAWLDVDADNSNMEISTVGTVDLTNAELLDAWPLAKTDSINIDTSKLNYLLLPDEYAVFTYSAAGSVDYEFINRWSELF